jgi:hypothetical protein
MMSWAYLLLCATWRPTSWIILHGVADAAGRVHGPSSDGRPDGRPIDPALQVAARVAMKGEDRRLADSLRASTGPKTGKTTPSFRQAK